MADCPDNREVMESSAEIYVNIDKHVQLVDPQATSKLQRGTLPFFRLAVGGIHRWLEISLQQLQSMLHMSRLHFHR